MKYLFSASAYLSRTMILFVIIIIVSCNNEQNQNLNTEKEKVEIVKTAVAEAFILNKGDLTSSFKIPGELIAFQQVDLYAKLNSYIKKMKVDVGSEVKAGQLLAELEAPEINAQLSTAQSKLKSQEAICFASKATYDRLVETNKTP
jgi:multidrug efflux pump subunit AcrA (membrane-fusion protein)